MGHIVVSVVSLHLNNGVLAFARGSAEERDGHSTQRAIECEPTTSTTTSAEDVCGYDDGTTPRAKQRSSGEHDWTSLSWWRCTYRISSHFHVSWFFGRERLPGDGEHPRPVFKGGGFFERW